MNSFCFLRACFNGKFSSKTAIFYAYPCHYKLQILSIICKLARHSYIPTMNFQSNCERYYSLRLLTKLHSSQINPRPDTVFRHLRPDRGGWCDPPGVSKRSVVELCGKDRQIALTEYSRLVILFLALGQYLTQFLQVKGQTFGNSMIFFKFTSQYQQNYLAYRHETFTIVFPVQFCTE